MNKNVHKKKIIKINTKSLNLDKKKEEVLFIDGCHYLYFSVTLMKKYPLPVFAPDSNKINVILTLLGSEDLYFLCCLRHLNSSSVTTRTEQGQVNACVFTKTFLLRFSSDGVHYYTDITFFLCVFCLFSLLQFAQLPQFVFSEYDLVQY